MAKKPFDTYFASKGQLPGDELIVDDEILVLRSGTIYRGAVDINFAFANLEGDATNTVISAVDVWSVIGGTLLEVSKTVTFTYAANAFTYIGPNQAHVTPIRAAVSLLGAVAADYQVGVFVNAVLVGLGMTVHSTVTQVGHVTTSAPYALQTGDVIDIRVRNVTDATDVIVRDASLEI